MLAGVALLSVLSAAQTNPGCTAPADLQASLSRKPSAEVYSALGYWFTERHKVSCAIPAFRSAVKLDPASFETRYNLGVALAETEDYAGAAEQLRAAVRLKPGEPNALGALRQVEKELATEAGRHFSRSLELTRANRRQDAIAELQAAIRLKPDYAAALGNLGVLFQQQGKASDAEAMFRRAVEAEPGNPQHYVNLGLTLADLKRYTEAAQALNKALDLAPDSPSAMTAKGMVLMRQQQMGEAIEVFRKTVAAEPGSAQAHLNLGVALADSERQAEALKSFDEAVRLAPDLAPAHVNRGRALYDLKRYEEAKQELETAQRLAPGDHQTVYRLGLTEARLNHPARAAELMAQVVAADPKNGSAHLELGQALLDTGRDQEGISHLRMALKLDPSSSQAAYALLRALSSRGSNETSQLGQRVRELKKEELAATQARALSNFALDAAKEKDWPKAIDGMRRAVETCGACPIGAALRRNLGIILAESGDLSGATAELEAARKLDPSDKDVAYALEVLPRLKGKQ